jgi:hypothetical protein
VGARLYTGRANPFYLAVDVRALAQRTGLLETDMAAYLLHRHQVKVFPGQFIYPNAALSHDVFSDVGRPAQAGPVPHAPPTFRAGAQIVYAPDYFSGRVALLRLSFGMETRVEAAAQALRRGLTGLWAGERPPRQRTAGNV